MTEPRWVPRLVVDSAHFDQLREHGGLPGVRDEGGLDAALNRARQKWTYKPDSDLAELAAAYGFGIAMGHPFVDGNKRVALVAMDVFLGLNGMEIDATEMEVVQVMLGLAAGDVTEEALAEWVRARMVNFRR